jgi:Uri superfamily endonuclease
LRYVPGCHLRRGWHAKRVWHVDHVDGHREHNSAFCLNDRNGRQHDQHRDRHHYERDSRSDQPD